MLFFSPPPAAQAQADGALIPEEQSGAYPAASGGAWIIPVQGDIKPSLTAFVRREAHKALSRGAAFIIFEIDTFGGRVDSALQITSFISSLEKVKTVAWIRNSENSMGVSWSAGALIALSCQEIYMASGTSVGAAAPVVMGADGSTQGTGEKTVAAVRSQIAALAEKNGYPTGIALAMVDYDVELWEVRTGQETKVLTLTEVERLERSGTAVEKITLISPGGKLLSLTAGEAKRYGLVRDLADTRDALLTALGASLEADESVPSVFDALVSFLTAGAVQAVLILVGLVMVFLELQSPGFGFFGVTAIIAFLLVFGSNALLGTVASMEMLLFLLGLGLLAVEIFILPGFGVVGIAGIFLIGVSLVLSMQDFVIPDAQWQWDLLGRNVVIVSLAIIASVAGIACIVLTGPRLRMFDPLTLKTSITGTAGGVYPKEAKEPAEGGGEDYTLLVGKTGKAVTTLRPSGKAQIEGKIYGVETDAAFSERGSAVRVARVLGNRIVVEVLET
jgi:membrane-bound serine protease (ClpP class)